MQRVVVMSYGRYGTTHRSDLQDLSRNYHFSPRNNPKERSSHLFRGGSLKPRINTLLLGGGRGLFDQ